MLFSATWRQKSQKIDFMNVFHGFIGFGSETANLFNTCRAQSGASNILSTLAGDAGNIQHQHLQGSKTTYSQTLKRRQPSRASKNQVRSPPRRPSNFPNRQTKVYSNDVRITLR